MGQVNINFNMFSSGLQALLMADGIEPGTKPSYELCKVIYSEHPHGAKIVDHPIQMAQFKPRKITVPKAPDDGEMLVEAFLDEWRALQADRCILNCARMARMYGVATIGLMIKDDDSNTEVDYESLARASIAFNIWDPLNTAGSLVLNQDPNSMDFQKVAGVSVNGKPYHRSRVCVIQNEDPIYINYEPSGFGFLGRSVYQRGLVPLKSFVMTLATDMMIALKAGVLVAKMKSQSSAVDGPMAFFMGKKRQMLKEAQTGQVLSIGHEEDIESINLQNLDGAYGMARKNIIENEASACGTPAKILLAETFAEGFGEGTEDAKAVAQFIETIRSWMQPLYSFMDQIVMYRAWNEDFFETVKEKYPEAYSGISYKTAFREWRNSFSAEWPNLLEEPDSEKLKGEEVVLKAIISVVEVLLPEIDPENKALVIEWMQDNLNERKRLFSSPMGLDFKAIADYEPPVPIPGAGDETADTFKKDSNPRRARSQEKLDRLDEAVKAAAKHGLKLIEGHAVAGGGLA